MEVVAIIVGLVLLGLGIWMVLETYQVNLKASLHGWAFIALGLFLAFALGLKFTV